LEKLVILERLAQLAQLEEVDPLEGMVIME
jgi:hypothetical protein